jgi:hypothetical protein
MSPCTRAFVCIGIALWLAIPAAPLAAQQGPELMRDALRPDLLGCYAVYSAQGKLLDATYSHASPRMRLDSSVLGVTQHDNRPGVVRLMLRLDKEGRPIDRSTPDQWPRMWWADSLTDSVRISFTDGNARGRCHTRWPTSETRHALGTNRGTLGSGTYYHRSRTGPRGAGSMPCCLTSA